MTYALLPIGDHALARVACDHARHDIEAFEARLLALGFSGSGGYAWATEMTDEARAKLERDAARGLIIDALNAATLRWGAANRGPSSACNRTALIQALLHFADHAEAALERLGTAAHGGREGFRPWTAQEWADAATDFAERLGARP